MSEAFFQVGVMGYITDSQEDQQSSIQAIKAAVSSIRHLKIQLSGWGIAPNSHVQVGFNTVPTILESVGSSNKNCLEELTIDLECLARDAILGTFCSLLASSAACSGLQKLSITCSGGESMPKQSLRELGKAFRNLNSVETLKLSGMDPEHLAVILQNMQVPHQTCPCVPACKRPCPRVAVPPCGCDVDQENSIYPSRMDNHYQRRPGHPNILEIERARLFHRAMTHLVYLLLDQKQSSISQLALRDCVHYTEDLGCLTFLIKGQSILRGLTLQRLRVCSFPGASSPWWNPCSMVDLNSVSSTTAIPNVPRLTTVQLLDCKGSNEDIETMTGALIQNPSLERLVLQYSTPDTCSTAIHSLNALYLSTVENNQESSLLELKVLAGPQMEVYRLHQLSAFLGHPNCILQSLTLDLGPGPYHDVLADSFSDNIRLNHLSLSGDEELEVTTLECFVEMLEDAAPQLKSLELNFPGIQESNEDVVRVFEANTTLESIQVHPAPGSCYSPTDLCYFGLRNRARHLLLSREAWDVETYKEVWYLLLSWSESPPADIMTRVGSEGKDLVSLSALWFVAAEYPSLVSELEEPLRRVA